MKINIGIVDDHQLFSKSLSMLLSSFPDFSVVVDATSGKDLQDKLKMISVLPDIMLIDVTMPEMDGIETSLWLKKSYPSIRLVALSMNDKEQTIIDMLKAGCCSYLYKDTHPDELEHALKEVYAQNYYDSMLHQVRLGQLIISNHLRQEKPQEELQFEESEKKFLQLATSDMTYKEIATLMNVSERTIDGYREMLFFKLKVQSRTGMVLEAYRRGLVKF